jgi:hypothetical protein
MESHCLGVDFCVDFNSVVSAIIEEGQSASPTAVRSIADILQSLQANGSAIPAGVDSTEVCAFVDSVDCLSQKRMQSVSLSSKTISSITGSRMRFLSAPPKRFSFLGTGLTN